MAVFVFSTKEAVNLAIAAENSLHIDNFSRDKNFFSAVAFEHQLSSPAQRKSLELDLAVMTNVTETRCYQSLLIFPPLQPDAHFQMLKNILTIHSQLGSVGVVGAKMIGHHTLVAPFISEVDVKEMEHSGVDQLSLLVARVVLHHGIVQNLTVFPPSRCHWRIAAAGRYAAQSHVVPPQSHRRLWVSCDEWFGKIICVGKKGKKFRRSMFFLKHERKGRQIFQQ